ncbi:MAG: Lrp/AsnC ligand binding domain-containing protein [Candidatus Baldrarchaeia archaeon]
MEEVEAYVLIVVSAGSEQDVLEKLRNINGVQKARITYGPWDIVVELRTNNMQDMYKAITEIRRIPEVEHTETLICA